MNTKTPPASTAIQIGRLAREGALFEVEAVAVMPERAAKAAAKRGAKSAKKAAKKPASETTPRNPHHPPPSDAFTRIAHNRRMPSFVYVSAAARRIAADLRRLDHRRCAAAGPAQRRQRRAHHARPRVGVAAHREVSARGGRR